MRATLDIFLFFVGAWLLGGASPRDAAFTAAALSLGYCVGRLRQWRIGELR